MKLRIKGNSLRVRLTQSEVDQLAKSGKVSDAINFGRAKLIYQLNLIDTNEISVDYENNLVQVNLPRELGSTWATSDQVGIEEQVLFGEKESLSILIEKDFKCLTDRPNEDESDLFENPLNQHNC